MQRNIFGFSQDVLINYEIDGDGRVPVIFLHGFAASLVTWDDIRKLFQKNLFRLYLLDLKGFGFSSKPRDACYGVADQADIVIAFIKALGLRNAVLIGHSFGGTVALHAALKSLQDLENGLIGRLILLDCAAFPQRMPPMMRILLRPLPAAALMRLVPARFIAWITLSRIFRNREAVTPERVGRYAGCFSRRGMPQVLIRTAGRLSVDGIECRFDYRSLRIPTLIIWGRDDPVTETWQAWRLHAEIEGSRIVIFDRCGHNPHEEYPVQTFNAIINFLGAKSA